LVSGEEVRQAVHHAQGTYRLMAGGD